MVMRCLAICLVFESILTLCSMCLGAVVVVEL